MRSPNVTPLPPRQGGLAEMPILHDSEQRTHCYRCKSLDHTVKDCPKSWGRNNKCKCCGKKGHPKKHCLQQVVGKGEDEDVTPEEDVASLIKSTCTLPKMTLEEWMNLLVKEEWRPEVCRICGRQGGQHTELECPSTRSATLAVAPARLDTSTATTASWMMKLCPWMGTTMRTSTSIGMPDTNS